MSVSLTEVRELEIVDERVPTPIRRLVDLAKAVTTIETKEQRDEVGQLHAKLGAERRETARQQGEDTELAAAIKRVDDLRSPYKFSIKILEECETFISGKLSTYDKAELQRARERQQATIAKTEVKNDAIVAKSEELGIKPVLKAPAVVVAPPKTVKTEDGQSSSRKTVYVFRIPGIGPDEDLAKLLGSDPRLATIDDALFLLNVGELKKQVKSPALHAHLQKQGITIEEEFDYSSRG